MKNILIINSSFRKGGNSETLAAQFAKGAKEAGHSIKTVNLRDVALKFCIGCLSCLKTGKCIHSDGVNELLPDVQNADIIAFATPVYYYSMCGQLKTFLDRLNPLYGQNNKFKDIYLLATAAEDDNSAMDGAIKGIQGWIDCFDGVRLAGVIYGTGADAIGDIQSLAAFKDAYNLGRSI